MSTRTITEALVATGHNLVGGTGGPCEKCWGDAYMRSLSDPSKSQHEHYEAIVVAAPSPSAETGGEE